MQSHVTLRREILRINFFHLVCSSPICESEISIDYPSRSSQFYFLSVTLRWLHILPRLDAGNASDERAGGKGNEKDGGRGA